MRTDSGGETLFQKIFLETSKMFNDFIKNHEHIALVIDEYNGVAGIITMEDVIETILGDEIVDETDKVADLQEYAIQQGKSMSDNVKKA